MLNKYAKYIKYIIVGFLLTVFTGCAGKPTIDISQEKSSNVRGQGISINTLNQNPRNIDITAIWNMSDITNPKKRYDVRAGAFDTSDYTLFVMDDEYLKAYHIATHELLWRTHITKSAEDIFSGQIKAIGTILIVTNQGGNIGAYDINTGKQIWARKLGDDVNSRLTSYKDTVLLQVDSEQVLAIDINTGKTKWVHNGTKTDVSFLEVAPVTVSGGVAYIVYPIGEVFAVNASTGENYWGRSFNSQVYDSITDEGNSFLAKPLVLDKYVYIISTTGGLVALNKENGTNKWYNKVSGSVDIVSSGDVIYALDNINMVWALDSLSGGVLWSNQLKTKIDGNITGFNSITLHAGRLILFSYSGKIQLLSIDTGSTISVHRAYSVSDYPLKHKGIILILDNSGKLQAYR